MNKFKYQVNKNTLLTPTVRSIILERDHSQKPMLFEPGQYATISLHDKFRPTATRSFSIASSPIDRYKLEFCVRVGGQYTKSLERLKKVIL